MHVGLYEGYVKATNALHAQLENSVEVEESIKRPCRPIQNSPDGWVLNTTAWCCTSTISGTSYREAAHVLRRNQDSGVLWPGRSATLSGGRLILQRRDVAGVGWAICNVDPSSGLLSNHWVTLHEHGNVAGFSRCWSWMWEHAYLLDYKPGERMQYIDAFLSVAWSAVEERMQAGLSPVLVHR